MMTNGLHNFKISRIGFVASSLLVTVLLLLVESSFGAPSVKLSVSPDKFAIGTQHTAKCALSGFDPNVVAFYGVALEFNSSNATINPGKNNTQMGSWVKLFDAAPVFTAEPLLPEANGLEVVSGVGSFPNFEFKFTPKSDVARGKYQCHVAIRRDLLNPDEEALSNVWNASSATIPSVVIFLVALTVGFKFQ